MSELNHRIDIIKNLFMSTHNIYHWRMDSDFVPISSNCPNDVFFRNVFLLGPCQPYMISHFKKNTLPILLHDNFDLIWIALKQEEDDQRAEYHLLGPIFTTGVSTTAILQLCNQLQFSANLKQDLPEQLKQVPVITLQQILDYCIMFHHCITGQTLTSRQIHVQEAPKKDLIFSDTDTASWHGTWVMESDLIRCVEEGNIYYKNSLSLSDYGGQVGKLSQDDLLRQAKNECIVFTALCTRAAIRGGISPEGGYNLGDYYIQRAEACTSVIDVHKCNTEMFDTCVRRVYQIKNSNKYSSAIRIALDYIETHIKEKIILEDMAKELGYAEYYLSSKFQKETGESINHYTQKRKIELAMQMLKSPSANATDISEILSFSSPSYFSTVFRKHTGMTPKEYQGK